MCCQLWGGCKINKNILYEQEIVDRHPNPNTLNTHITHRIEIISRYSSSERGAYSVVGIYRSFGNILDREVFYCLFIYSPFNRWWWWSRNRQSNNGIKIELNGMERATVHFYLRHALLCFSIIEFLASIIYFDTHALPINCAVFGEPSALML